MDVQVQELIDKIKKDGVASAESAAQDIISTAEKKAASIIKEANEKAEAIIENAKAETARLEKASNDAIEQAGRNLLLSFREGINRQLSAIVSAETEKAFDKDVLKKLVPETVKAWAASPDASDLAVLLPPKSLKELESSLTTALKTQISKGLELKSDDSLATGFRIGSKDGAAFYDFSAEELASLFSAYLNPKTTEIMRRAAEGLPPEKKTGDAGDVQEKPAVRRGRKATAAKDSE